MERKSRKSGDESDHGEHVVEDRRMEDLKKLSDDNSDTTNGGRKGEGGRKAWDKTMMESITGVKMSDNEANKSF